MVEYQLFAFGSDKLSEMNAFQEVIRSLEVGNKWFESYPKRMLINHYALTIYFNAACVSVEPGAQTSFLLQETQRI